MTYSKKKFSLDRPLIVIGAGRSGTTMVRHALMQHREVASFEFEMNPLWKYGNEHINHDMLNVSDNYSGKAANYIQKAFISKSLKSQKPRVLDKTVANVMRLAYIQKVLPDAKVLHIIRDGRSVSASAIARWSTKHPASYFLKKLKTVPIRSLPRLSLEVISSKFSTILQNKNYRQTWGSRWPGIDDDVAKLPLASLCAKQWVMQVETALCQKNQLRPNSYLEIRYEDLVLEPKKVFAEISSFFELSFDQKLNDWVSATIDNSRTEKWREYLDEEQLKLVLEQSSDLLGRLGYLR
jgi:hypothetical protein